MFSRGCVCFWVVFLECFECFLCFFCGGKVLFLYFWGCVVVDRAVTLWKNCFLLGGGGGQRFDVYCCMCEKKKKNCLLVTSFECIRI